MNIKDYIESGVLEAYVLGALPEQERAEVEANIAEYPEIQQEVAAIESAMQQFAASTSVQPPVHLQEQIWTALNADNVNVISDSGANEATPGKTIPFTPTERSRQMNWQRAAVWIALAGSLLTNFYLWSQRNGSEQRAIALQQQMDTISHQQERLVTTIDMYEQERRMLADPGMKTIVMQSAQEGKTMTGMVFWSKEKGDTYLSLVNMPMPPQGMQYQLWVIENGKPVDMGVVPNNMVYGGMQKIDKSVSGGQAFAISLEKEGGNPTPTTVMVVGSIAS